MTKWFIWGLCATYFFAHYMVRVAPSVMIPDLMEDFGVSAVTLGQFAAFFYYPYLLCQLPMGLLIDKMGPRLILTIAVFVSGCSALLFATTDTIMVANIARLLLGVSAASAFIGSLKIATQWFPPARLALIIGSTQSLGMLGGVTASLCLSSLNHNHGWRSTFWILGIGLFLLSFSIACFVKNQPNILPIQTTKTPILSVLCHRQTWLNAFFCGLIFLPIEIIGEFWGIDFLSTVHPITPSQANVGNAALFIGCVCGGPLTGSMADRFGRRTLMQIGSALSTFFLLLLIFNPMTATPLYGVLFVFGLSSACLSAAYTLVGELHPKNATGLALAIANMMTVLLGALCHPLVGFFLDSHLNLLETAPLYTTSGYQVALLICPISTLLAFICASFSKETLIR